MTTAPMKSQPLHNFSLSFLKWGTHHPNPNHNRTRTPPPTEPDTTDDSTRHHRVVGSRSSRAQRLSFPSSTSKPQQDAVERPQRQTADTEEEEEDEVGRPWNLRPRKVQETLVDVAVFQNRGDNNANTKAPKSTRLREMVESRGSNGDKKEKNKFWVTLSREEIEEDIFIMTGSRPARRPRKRPKNVQKQLDNVFPGLWLVGLTADAYRVSDAPMKFDDGFCGGDVVTSNLGVLKAYVESREDCTYSI
ncbi:Chromogranin [Citrus sinensis]|nr:Chromogranin [Citrus sinensis]